MTDLEMTKLCAEAMGYDWSVCGQTVLLRNAPYAGFVPLHDDAQAMALVKQLDLEIRIIPETEHIKKRYQVSPLDGRSPDAISSDLNHSIVECAALVQSAKQETV